MNWYNGFNPNERERKLRALHRNFPNRSHPYYHCECHMCGDSEAKIAPHGEDYGQPYRWEKPAVFDSQYEWQKYFSSLDFPTRKAWLTLELFTDRVGFDEFWDADDNADEDKDILFDEIRDMFR